MYSAPVESKAAWLTITSVGCLGTSFQVAPASVLRYRLPALLATAAESVGVASPFAPLLLSKRTAGMPIPLSLSEAEKLATFSQVDAESLLRQRPAFRDPK